MIVTADTNLFVYAVDGRDPAKQVSALDLIEVLETRRSPIALQVCGEFFRACTRRLNRSGWEAAQGARNLMTAYRTFGPTRSSTERALAEAAAGRFSYWDAALLAAAEEAECTHILSEDMQDGVCLGRIEVVRPFAAGDVSERARELLRL
jgi:predicted nucleic acid-binding protein